MKTRHLFFVMNQDPMDGSAHALYCMRHLRSLARAAPDGFSVTLVCPSRSGVGEILGHHHLGSLANFRIRRLPSLRRGGDGVGLHVNAVFHWAAWLFLRANARSGDIVATASFPRLLDFLGRRWRGKKDRPQLVYEVHQLECLSRPADHPKCRREFAALAFADRLLTTTIPLETILRKLSPHVPLVRIGLATGYAPVDRRVRAAGEAFRVGYFGSVSPEQGVPWLAAHWPGRTQGGVPLELHIFGRARRGEPLPESAPARGIFVHTPVVSDDVPSRCLTLDALIIPALDQGHRAAIAFTKAYDYLGLALPVLSSDLGTIREVVRPEREGLFFSPGDAASLHAQISRLAEDTGLQSRLCEACRVRAPDFSWADRAGRWWDAMTT